MKKKRLLIDVNSVVPFYASGKISGIGRTTLELVKALDEIRDELPFEVTLYSQNMKGIGGRNTQTGFHNKHLYLPHRPKFNHVVKTLGLRELLSPYELLHIPHNYDIVRRPEKCVVTIHDAMFMKMDDARYNYSSLRRNVTALSIACKHIITCSEHSKKDLVETIQIPEEKVSVVYWGMKHECFYVKEDRDLLKDDIKNRLGVSNPFFIDISCNPIWRKRTDKLVEGFIRYCEMGGKYDLVLVWGNPDPEIEKRFGNNIYFKDRIHYLKGIDDSMLSNLYNCSKALFFPSQYEGFGLPIIEAMACGTLVVTAKNSSLAEIGLDVPIYLNEENIVQSIADTMYNIEQNKIDMQSHIKKGLERAKDFTWSNCAKQTASIYEKLLLE